MTVRLARPSQTRDVSFVGDAMSRARSTCAFVNNMPDGAFDATERQFLGSARRARVMTLLTCVATPWLACRGANRRAGASPRSTSR